MQNDNFYKLVEQSIVKEFLISSGETIALNKSSLSYFKVASDVLINNIIQTNGIYSQQRSYAANRFFNSNGHGSKTITIKSEPAPIPKKDNGAKPQAPVAPVEDTTGVSDIV